MIPPIRSHADHGDAATDATGSATPAKVVPMPVGPRRWAQVVLRYVSQWKPQPPTPTLEPAERRQARERHARMLERVLRQPLCEGNHVTLLAQQQAAQEALVEAIDSARDHINLQLPWADVDGAAYAMLRRLAARRRDGVKVHVLLDAPADAELRVRRWVESLQASGVRVCCAAPPRSRAQVPPGRLLVVDGRVAFAALPMPHASSRDAQLCLRGPVVALLQQRFIERWAAHAGERPLLAHYFPRLLAAGDEQVTLAGNPPDTRSQPALLHAVRLAQDRVTLSTQRFAPAPALLQALQGAARRGALVRLLLPGAASGWACHAARAHYAALLQAGVHVHECQGMGPAADAAVIDGAFAAVGTPLDSRAGAQMIVIAEAFAKALDALLAEDLRAARKIAWSDWRRRSGAQRLLQAIARRCLR